MHASTSSRGRKYGSIVEAVLESVSCKRIVWLALKKSKYEWCFSFGKYVKNERSKKKKMLTAIQENSEKRDVDVPHHDVSMPRMTCNAPTRCEKFLGFFMVVGEERGNLHFVVVLNFG